MKFKQFLGLTIVGLLILRGIYLQITEDSPKEQQLEAQQLEEQLLEAQPYIDHRTEAIIVKKKPKKAPTQKELIEAQFSRLDGSHIKLAQLVKNNIRNPRSFDHDQTFYSILDENRLQVEMYYYAENAFGGTVREKVVAYTDIATGEILEIVGYE